MKNYIKQLQKNIMQLFGLRPFSLIETIGDEPLCRQPLADAVTYQRLFQEAKNKVFPDIDAFEQQSGFAIAKGWLDELAFHTQIVIKKSELNYQHGRLLYASLCRYLQESGDNIDELLIFETGTARGFSALVMAKALADIGKNGKIFTVDILPVAKKIYWNCIDDLEGKKTRRELLNPWQKLLERIIFVQYESKDAMRYLDCQRIHFAFLDANHIYEDVMNEFDFVASRQQAGDCIIFDDVTEVQFPGVVRAVEEIAQKGEYHVRHIASDEKRGYAILKRI